MHQLVESGASLYMPYYAGHRLSYFACYSLLFKGLIFENGCMKFEVSFQIDLSISFCVRWI